MASNGLWSVSTSVEHINIFMESCASKHHSQHFFLYLYAPFLCCKSLWYKCYGMIVLSSSVPKSLEFHSASFSNKVHNGAAIREIRNEFAWKCQHNYIVADLVCPSMKVCSLWLLSFWGLVLNYQCDQCSWFHPFLFGTCACSAIGFAVLLCHEPASGSCNATLHSPQMRRSSTTTSMPSNISDIGFWKMCCNDDSL